MEPSTQNTVPGPKLCAACGEPIVEEYAGDSGCCCYDCYKALGIHPKRGMSSLITALSLGAMAFSQGEGRRSGPWAQYRADHPKHKDKKTRERRAKNRVARASRKKNRR